MPAYLSDAWLAELHRRVSTDAGVRTAAARVSLVVQHVVTGGPDGERRWHLVVDDGTCALRAGTAADPTVTLQADVVTAAAIAAGELNAQSAFLDGRLELRGDLKRLVAAQPLLLALDAAMAGVHADARAS